jgi:predicted ATP-grasp superfamily ATP-dependent carboligase
MAPTADPLPSLLIVGSSARAAAHSALRGGLLPLCVDHFGDIDLALAARTATVSDYPAGLVRAAHSLPPTPWMYTGGLENHPRIIAKLSARRTLLGNGPAVLAHVRNPWRVAEELTRAGLPALDLWPPGTAPPPRDGRWIAKPRRGAGGRGIHLWNQAAPAPRESVWFQRQAIGGAYSAQFLAWASGVVLLGVTRQLIGLSEVAAPPFAWCGAQTVTATSPANALIDTMREIGNVLAATTGLTGLFGCDFIADRTTPWLVEVNPRYTAAMELVDHQLGHSLVAWHWQACTGAAFEGPDPGGELLKQSAERSAPLSGRCLGKIVLFAECDRIIGDALDLLRPPGDAGLPEIADLPRPGQRIPAGQPVCSLFASDATDEGCRARLIESARTFRERFTRPA